MFCAGQPHRVSAFRHGERWFVLLGALRGDKECNTSGVVEGIIAHFTNRPDELPNDVTIYAIPLINQDGCTTYTRSNANGVDLNRNWDTSTGRRMRRHQPELLLVLGQLSLLPT
ncbi:MAG: hypothetical protein IPH82_19735 [Chloroflexi bacterium]|nr:hypothetical protein [Chloroflexota bacterium]